MQSFLKSITVFEYLLNNSDCVSSSDIPATTENVCTCSSLNEIPKPAKFFLRESDTNPRALNV